MNVDFMQNSLFYEFAVLCCCASGTYFGNEINSRKNSRGCIKAQSCKCSLLFVISLNALKVAKLISRRVITL
jgi:hypothetical protein